MNNTTYKVLNPFTVISNADETIRFWVPKKQEDGTMIFVAGFDVKAYPLFLDHKIGRASCRERVYVLV